MRQARSEVYTGHLGSHLCFLPGVPWLQLGQRILPDADVQELATCIRRVARLLWAVHLSFQQGFDGVRSPSHRLKQAHWHLRIRSSSLDKEVTTMHNTRGAQQVCGLPETVQLLASSSEPKAASYTVSFSARVVATVSA